MENSVATHCQIKLFTDEDVTEITPLYPRIFLGDYHKELLYDPPEWMSRGLQETASGYCKRLNSGYKISFNGKLYRLYTTIFSNNGTTWFVVKGRKIYVD